MLDKNVKTSDLLSVTVDYSHQCNVVQSEKAQLLEHLKADLLTLNWQHQTCQRLCTKLLNRATEKFGIEYLEQVGFPKPGIQ